MRNDDHPSAPDPAPIAAPVALSRQSIMDATAACLSETGYEATTIRQIASRLGCAVGSVYRYFPDKWHLLYAVTQQHMDPVASQAEIGCAFEQSVVLYHEYAASAPQTYQLMFWLAAVNADPTPKTDAPRATPELPPVVQRIIRCWSAQLGDPNAAGLCWMTLHGCLILGKSAQETLSLIRAQLQTEPRAGALEPVILPRRAPAAEPSESAYVPS